MCPRSRRGAEEGAYRITDRGLRWDERLAKRLQREYDHIHSRRIRETNG